MTYNDPTILHPGKCTKCGACFRDADMLEDGLCFACVEEEKLDADDYSDPDLYPWMTDRERDFALRPNPQGWFGIASGIVWGGEKT